MKFEHLEEAGKWLREMRHAEFMIEELKSEKPMCFSMPGGDGLKGFQVVQYLPSVYSCMREHYQQVINMCKVKLVALGITDIELPWKAEENQAEGIQNDT